MLTVKDIRQIIKGLPGNMKVVLGVDDSLEDICAANVDVVTIQFDDTHERETVLVLPVCVCDLEDAPEIGEINSQPELN